MTPARQRLLFIGLIFIGLIFIVFLVYALCMLSKNLMGIVPATFPSRSLSPLKQMLPSFVIG